MNKNKITTVFEFTGSFLAILYAILIASNTENETSGFILLLVSALLFAGWAIIDKRWSFLVLQFFYVITAIIGLIRW